MQVDRYDVVIGTNLFMKTPCALGIRLQDKTIRPVLHVSSGTSDHTFLVSLDAVDTTGAHIQLRDGQPVGGDAERFEVLHLPGQTRVINRQTGGMVAEIIQREKLEIHGDFCCAGIRIVATAGILMIQKLRVFGHRYRDLGGILLSPTTGFVVNFLGTIPPLPPL